MDPASKKLRVGLILDGGLEKPDGVQQYVLAIGGWLRQQGHSVSYLVAGEIPEHITGAYSLASNIHVSSNGNRLAIPLPASRRRLRKFLKVEQFDVLHVQTPYSPLMGEQLILGADKRTAIIGTFHVLPNAWYFAVGNRLLGLWCWRSLRRFDTMLSVSTAAQTFAKQTFKIDSEVLPNVIDYPRFHNAKALSKYQDDVLTILFFGRLVARKGCLVLLQAVASLVNSQQSIPKFRVVICGSGPLEKQLRDYVRKNKLDQLVEFIGFVSEHQKPAYYASADISVFPSSGGESFGIVLLEAMASGQACVLAGDNPGYHSVMAASPETLFSPKDVEALAKKLADCLSDSSLRKRLASWGEAYTKDFDVDIVGTKLLTIYDQALRKRRS